MSELFRPTLLSINAQPATTLITMRGQLAYLREQGFRVIAIASPGPALAEVARQENVDIQAILIERELSPARDLVALWRLYQYMRHCHADIIHAGTPKAALLSMLAAWAARVPVRIYAIKGLRLETTRGWKRRLLRFTERLTAACCTSAFCASPSLAKRYQELCGIPPQKLVVFGAGMLNGVDAARFFPEQYSAERVAALRSSLGIPADSFVIGFVGRLVRDKGLLELYQAFERLHAVHPQIHLLLVGESETGDPLPDETAARLRNDPHVTLTGFVDDTAIYYQLMDVHALPSSREGFPNSPMEAAAAEVPTVGFAATGTVDAVVAGETGQLVACGDVAALAAAIDGYLVDADLRSQHGKQARLRVENEFAREPIWAATLAEYLRLLKAAGIECTNLTIEPTIGAT